MESTEHRLEIYISTAYHAVFQKFTISPKQHLMTCLYTANSTASNCKLVLIEDNHLEALNIYVAALRVYHQRRSLFKRKKQ